MSAELTQDNWVERLRAGGDVQAEALAQLRRVLVLGLKHSMAQRGGGESFCEDIAQETLIKVMEKLDQFEGRSKFTTWAMSIAVRLAISELRRRHFQNVSLEEVTGGEGLRVEIAVDPAATPQKQAEQQSILDSLRQLIDETLTEKQRLALKATLGGMPIEQIAEKMDTNRNALYKLVFDARQKLKAGLEAAGFSAADIATAFE